MNTKTTSLFLLLSLFVFDKAFAFRCHEKLVLEGDSKYAVFTKCGEPLDKQVFEQQVPTYNAAGYQVGTTTVITEHWIYQSSPNEFHYELIFNNGVLKEITANRSN